jgi:SAM-dependent methyltransferase
MMDAYLPAMHPGKALEPVGGSASDRCEICASTELQRFSAPEMMYGGKEMFEYVYCAACESTYQPRRLDDYAPYYPENYYSFKFQEPRTWGERLRMWKRNARNRYYYFARGWIGWLLSRFRPQPIDHLSRHVRLRKEMSILEIGCGTGELLFEIGELGLAKVVGIDPFIAENVTYRNGARVLKETLSGFRKSNPGEQFDLVMFNHSLEHSPDPFSDLMTAKSLMKKDGELLIRWPISGSRNAKDYGVHWWSLDSPRHIYLFSVKSLKILAERIGLKVKRTHFEGTIDDFMASEQHRLGIALRSGQSYVVSGDTSRFSKDEIQAFQRQIDTQNRDGSASQAGFVLGNSTE